MAENAQELFDFLSAPFPSEFIDWRVGSTTADKAKGMALAYIDARDVMGRLDEVMTPAGWQCSYPHANGKTVCSVGLKIDGEWIWKADGAGDTDYEAEKGALSDSFKRGAVRWGVGRYLYELPSPWVEVEQRGKTYIIKDSERPKLETLLEQYTGKIEWGSPGEVAMARALYQSVKSMVHTAEDVERYRETNAGVLANLRKKPREHIEQLLTHVGNRGSKAWQREIGGGHGDDRHTAPLHC